MVKPGLHPSKSGVVRGLSSSSEQLSKYSFATGCHCSLEQPCLGFSWVCAGLCSCLRQSSVGTGAACDGANAAARAVQESLRRLRQVWSVSRLRSLAGGAGSEERNRGGLHRAEAELGPGRALGVSHSVFHTQALHGVLLLPDRRCPPGLAARAPEHQQREGSCFRRGVAEAEVCTSEQRVSTQTSAVQDMLCRWKETREELRPGYHLLLH